MNEKLIFDEMMERELQKSEESPTVSPLEAKPSHYIETPSHLGRPDPQAARHQNYIDTPAQSDYVACRIRKPKQNPAVLDQETPSVISRIGIKVQIADETSTEMDSNRELQKASYLTDKAEPKEYHEIQKAFADATAYVAKVETEI